MLRVPYTRLRVAVAVIVAYCTLEQTASAAQALKRGENAAMQFGHSIAERKRGRTPISTQCSMSSSVLQTTRHCTRSQCQWKRTRSLHLSIAALSLRARVSNCVVEQMVMGTWRRVTSTPQLRVLFSPIYEPA